MDRHLISGAASMGDPMKVYLVRHAHAGQRSHDGRDIYRPLSDEGRDRAVDLIQIFADQPVDLIMSSPASRCVQTLEPLAEQREMAVTESQELWEGSSIHEAITALENAGTETVVACSHGDIIPGLIDTLAGSGATISGRGCELGSIWILNYADGKWTDARYVSSRDQALA
jgi:8-oxo-dGTP diphosphatase